MVESRLPRRRLHPTQIYTHLQSVLALSLTHFTHEDRYHNVKTSNKNESTKLAAEEGSEEEDLVRSDDEDEDDVKAELDRLRTYVERKDAKPNIIAKSIVTLDVLVVIWW
jgi:hypothetical protein